MDYDHSPNCERRLFGKACTCDAPERDRVERENAALLEANDGVMPLASERARAKQAEDQQQVVAVESEPDAILTASKKAIQKLTDQGLTHEEAMRVIVRRIEG